MIYSIQHKFVDEIPADLDEGVLYISTRFAIVLHKCCCGCQEKVAARLDPSRWRITFDGQTVSLYPSIGNWALPCQSHYLIVRNQVVWDEQEGVSAEDWHTLRRSRWFRNAWWKSA